MILWIILYCFCALIFTGVCMAIDGKEEDDIYTYLIWSITWPVFVAGYIGYLLITRLVVKIPMFIAGFISAFIRRE